MTESQSRIEISRAEFLKTAAFSVGGMLLPNWLKAGVTSGVESRQSSSEQFDATPSWEQDFSQMKDGQPSSKYWNYTVGNTVAGYTGDAETYTNRRQNVRIENGVLVIEAKQENLDNREYTSARIDTQDNFEFLYGKLEISAKLPEGIGTWPAGWLLPSNPRYNPSNYGLTGSSANWRINGEIDIFEAIGANPGLVYPSVHTADNISQETNGSDPFHIIVPDDTQNFHSYGVEKLPNSIVFTFDGKPYYTVDKHSSNPEDWPFNQPYYLILNLAMGGSWGGIDKSKFPPYGIDNSQESSWKLEVGSIAYKALA